MREIVKQELEETYASIPAPPCEQFACEHACLCGKKGNELACSAFVTYVNDSIVAERPAMERPTRILYLTAMRKPPEQNGGKRQGAGRPPGSRDSRPRQRNAAAASAV